MAERSKVKKWSWRCIPKIKLWISICSLYKGKKFKEIYDRKGLKISLVFGIAINLSSSLFNSRNFNGTIFKSPYCWTNGYQRLSIWSVLQRRNEWPVFFFQGASFIQRFSSWKCELEICVCVHKLSPNWPRAGNSSGSISDARIISSLDLWLFGKVKVIYKHYQSNFQCTGVLSLYKAATKMKCFSVRDELSGIDCCLEKTMARDSLKRSFSSSLVLSITKQKSCVLMPDFHHP